MPPLSHHSTLPAVSPRPSGSALHRRLIMARTRRHPRMMAGIAALAASLTFAAIAAPTGAAGTVEPAAVVNATAAEPVTAAYGPNDAPVLIVLGQSNAVGPRVTDPADIATCRNMPNVVGLRRDVNRAAGLANATWGAYTCENTNLGDDAGAAGPLYNTATSFAMRWQRAIDSGTDLPNLHVIHVAWSGQGITAESGVDNRWWPERPGNSVESLHQLTVNTITNALRALHEQGKTPRILGLHWNQWESEALHMALDSAEHAEQAYREVLGAFVAPAGDAWFPIYLYRPRSTALHLDQVTKGFTVEAFESMAAAEGSRFRIMDPADATLPDGTALFDPAVALNYGIYGGDGVHYTAAVQRWFADAQWDAVFDGAQRGAPVLPTENASVGRPATQSSTNGAAVAARAVDGNADGNFAAGSVTHTGLDQNPWWQVDLGSVREIDTIRISKRTDCCDDRIVKSFVFVSDTEMTGKSLDELIADENVWAYRLKRAPGNQLTVPVAHDGRFVRVQKVGESYFSLAEVMVDARVEDPDARVPVSLIAESRCVHGQAYLAVKVTNDDNEPISVRVQTPIGEKSFSSVAAGTNVVATFNARATSVPVGEASALATRLADGADTSHSTTFDARDCG